MVKKLEKQIDISVEAKSKLKDIYKEVIIDEISEQLTRQHKAAMIVVENKLNEKNLRGEGDKKQNKKILAKLEEIIIRIEMIEANEEKEINALQKNSRTLIIGNIVLLVGLFILILVKI